jgi:oligoribonuclease
VVRSYAREGTSPKTPPLTQTGLTERVLTSEYSPQQVESAVLDYIKTYVPLARSAHLAGNSVHFDKEFLRLEFPSIIEYLSYRIIGTPLEAQR